MPNVGRPSLGCQTCKTRRVKCDLARPYCSRCKKAGRHCPGVPDPIDAVLREQRQPLVTKSKGTPPPPSSANDWSFADPSFENHQYPDDGPLDLKAADFSLSVVDEPYFSVDYQAVSFFFQHYRMFPKSYSSPLDTTKDFTVKMYSEARPSSPLELSVSAFAMSILSKFPSKGPLRQQAQLLYSKAVRSLTAAINDKTQFLSDETLLSVMLLQFYESLSFSYKDSASNYQNHLDGAVALLRLRGRPRADSVQSLKLYRSVRSYMVVNQIVKSATLEPFTNEEDWSWDSDLDAQPSDRLICIATRIPELRSRIKELENTKPSADNAKEAMILLREAAEVDQDLREWYATTPGYMKHTSVGKSQVKADAVQDFDMWPGVAHVYENVWLAGFMNNYRTFRIYTNGVIIRTMTWLSLSPNTIGFTTTPQEPIAVIQHMVDEICASVPYFFGVRLDKTDLVAAAGKDKVASGAAGGWFLVWPLWSACGVETLEAQQTAWLRKKLDLCVHVYGFVQPRMWAMLSSTGITRA